MILFSTCKKEDTNTSPQTDESASFIEASEQDADAQSHYDELFRITLGVQSADAGEDIGIGSGADIIYSAKTSAPDNLRPETPDSARCFTVSVTPQTLHVFPKTVTLDFGTGCIGKDGKTRKGKIISVYTGPMFLSGSNVTTTLDNYQVDSFKIEGTQVIENNSTTVIEWKTNVSGGKITNMNSGRWKAWEGSRTNKQIDGMSTPFILADDIYQITGNASGANSNNNAWTAEITVPLNWKFSCHWISKGTVHTTRNARSADLDYDDGACDNKAILTVDGISHHIILRK